MEKETASPQEHDEETMDRVAETRLELLAFLKELRSKGIESASALAHLVEDKKGVDELSKFTDLLSRNIERSLKLVPQEKVKVNGSINSYIELNNLKRDMGKKLEHLRLFGKHGVDGALKEINRRVIACSDDSVMEDVLRLLKDGLKKLSGPNKAVINVSFDMFKVPNDKICDAHRNNNGGGYQHHGVTNNKNACAVCQARTVVPNVNYQQQYSNSERYYRNIEVDAPTADHQKVTIEYLQEVMKLLSSVLDELPDPTEVTEPKMEARSWNTLRAKTYPLSDHPEHARKQFKIACLCMEFPLPEPQKTLILNALTNMATDYEAAATLLKEDLDDSAKYSDIIAQVLAEL